METLISPKYETEMAQDLNEILQFIELLRREEVKSYLEIGARYGASVWRIATSLPVGSRIVTVDWPVGWGGRPDGQEVLHACFKQLAVMGYDAHLILGDSMSSTSVEAARRLGPYDCVFIDAHHGLTAVTSDWTNYGAMARIVAFHDIAWQRPKEWMPHRKRLEVPKLWNQIKTKYRHQEIKCHPTGRDNGIGVLWKNSPRPVGSK
jgi:predicted O-methyltransferase YrrM